MARNAIWRTQVTCAVLVACGSAPALAQTATARAAFARELRDSIESVLRVARADSAFPGAYALVGDSRGVLAEFGVGHIDWKRSPRPTERTLWDLASLTKVIGTTTALAQLIEQGRVQVDSPVQHYVPDWRGPGKERVTVRMLLTHTSGLPAFEPYDHVTHRPDSIATLLFETPLQFTPGDTMVYSDIGAFMMGQVIEHVSHETIDVYFQHHIFGPLKMHDTRYNPPRTQWWRVAPTEFDSLRGGLVRGKVHDERAYYLGGVAAHAGLFSTAADLSRFARMLLNGGELDGVRILRPETVARFTTYADSGRSNRALGWEKAPASWAGDLMSSRAFGHTGFTGTSIAIDPEAGIYVILLSNRVNPTRANPRIPAVRRRLANAVMSVVREHRAPTSNADTSHQR